MGAGAISSSIPKKPSKRPDKPSKNPVQAITDAEAEVTRREVLVGAGAKSLEKLRKEVTKGEKDHGKVASDMERINGEFKVQTCLGK